MVKKEPPEFLKSTRIKNDKVLVAYIWGEEVTYGCKTIKKS